MMDQKETKNLLKENKISIKKIADDMRRTKDKIKLAKSEIKTNSKSFKKNAKYLKNKKNEWSEEYYNSLLSSQLKWEEAIKNKYQHIIELNKLLEKYKLLSIKEKELKFGFVVIKKTPPFSKIEQDDNAKSNEFEEEDVAEIKFDDKEYTLDLKLSSDIDEFKKTDINSINDNTEVLRTKVDSVTTDDKNNDNIFDELNDLSQEISKE